MANHTQGKSPCKEKWQQKEYNFEFLTEYFYFFANDMLGENILVNILIYFT